MHQAQFLIGLPLLRLFPPAIFDHDAAAIAHLIRDGACGVPSAFTFEGQLERTAI